MLGCYDFCGHYAWTFDWLERAGGRTLLREFWAEAISRDAQAHLAALVQREGFAGMRRYWAHTLAEESPAREFTITERPGVFRIDMHACPSRGFLLRNGLATDADYCDHCMGWIGPTMGAAGYVIDHEHNHCGQCWWEIHRCDEPAAPRPVGELAGPDDVRNGVGWLPASPGPIDRYLGATDPDAKQTAPGVAS